MDVLLALAVLIGVALAGSGVAWRLRRMFDPDQLAVRIARRTAVQRRPV